ncbi:hypothetical protein, partial [Thermincola ferriacetica]
MTATPELCAAKLCRPNVRYGGKTTVASRLFRRTTPTDNKEGWVGFSGYRLGATASAKPQPGRQRVPACPKMAKAYYTMKNTASKLYRCTVLRGSKKPLYSKVISCDLVEGG